MPVTLNNTTITIDDGTNNFVLETVKTHVPEQQIIENIDEPDLSYNTTQLLQQQAESNTGVNGWRVVRFLPPTSSLWHPTNDNLAGTDIYGTTYNYSVAWSVAFGNFDEFVFSTKGLNHWLQVSKFEAIGEVYSNDARTIIKSSVSPTSYTANWYNRTNTNHHVDPWIGLRTHGTGPANDPENGGDLILYAEASFGNHWSTPAISIDGGMCVFVRSSTDTISRSLVPAMSLYTDPTEILQYRAETVTGVKGWIHVKHLPASSTNWYSGDGNLQGTYSLNSSTKLDSEEWSILWNNKNEILFSKDIFDKWLRINSTDISEGTGWTNKTAIDGINGVSQLYKYNGYGVGGYNPNIHWNTGTNYTNDTIYVETTGGYNWAGTPTKPSVDYDVFVRSSTDTVSINPDPTHKILTFTHDGSANNQTEYTVNFPENTTCDILIVGGGGGGGYNTAGGGGSGAGIISLNNTFNGTYTIKVGKGGDNGITGSLIGGNGYDSIISKNSSIIFNANGGGGGGDSSSIGNQGGSAGGSGNSNTTSQTPLNTNVVNGTNNISPVSPGTISVSGQDYIVLGTSGGSGAGGDAGGGYGYEDINGGGGGGLGQVGQNATRTTPPGDGGDGIYKVSINSTDYNLKEYFSPNSPFGVYNLVDTYYYIGGGGGGGGYQITARQTEGGLGGGGQGRDAVGGGVAGSGINHTGSGGGGGEGNIHTAGAGGSGIVIIRYKTTKNVLLDPYDAQWTYHSTNPNVHHYGNVGIGTLASETNKLTVKGDINVIGDIYENNNKIAYGWNVSGNSIYNQFGNVGIGTTDPRYGLDTTGIIYAGQGGITETGSTTWTITSDNRIKDNIEKASYDICSENIKNINLYRFNYNDKYVKTTDKNQLGFIAQDVKKYFPKAVKNKTTRFDNDVVPNLLSVDVTQLNYAMYGAVKHIGQDIDAIKEKLGITELPNDVKNQPYFTEVVPFNDPDAELPIVNEEPATN